MLVVEIATLSRSGLLGLGVGALVLALPYRGYLKSRALIAPIAGALAVLAVVVVSRLHFFLVVIRSRIQTGGGSQSAHFQVYSFIPQILHSHPLLGLGLNNFSIYYQAVTGKTNWGPHSFYVSLIVETGIVGTVLFACFLIWVFVRLILAQHLGDALAKAGDPLAARVRPLAWGWTAALAGTMASNAFYLTMSFYYFYVFLALALAVPLVFGPAAAAPKAVPATAAPRGHPGARTPSPPEPLRVCVVTTSYPRSAGDVAGVFVAAQVERLRAAGSRWSSSRRPTFATSGSRTATGSSRT